MTVNVGARIAERRKELSISRKELATTVDLSEKSLQRYEDGLTSPNLDTLQVIASALNLSLRDLVSEAERSHASAGTERRLLAHGRTLYKIRQSLEEVVSRLEVSCSELSLIDLEFRTFRVGSDSLSENGSAAKAGRKLAQDFVSFLKITHQRGLPVVLDLSSLESIDTAVVHAFVGRLIKIYHPRIFAHWIVVRVANPGVLEKLDEVLAEHRLPFVVEVGSEGTPYIIAKNHWDKAVQALSEKWPKSSVATVSEIVRVLSNDNGPAANKSEARNIVRALRRTPILKRETGSWRKLRISTEKITTDKMARLIVARAAADLLIKKGTLDARIARLNQLRDLVAS